MNQILMVLMFSSGARKEKADTGRVKAKVSFDAVSKVMVKVKAMASLTDAATMRTKTMTVILIKPPENTLENQGNAALEKEKVDAARAKAKVLAKALVMDMVVILIIRL